MANQTENREAGLQDGKQRRLVAAAQHFYQGELVSFAAATGLLAKAGDNAGDRVAGIVVEEKDNTGVAAGADPESRVLIQREGEAEFVYGPGGATQANVGDEVVASDSQTVTTAGAATNDVVVGTIVEVVDATHVRVQLTER